MRETEYRGRCGTKDSWFYGDLKVKNGQPYIVPRDGHDICFKAEPETVGEYIGLKAADSNRYRIVNWKREKDPRIFEGNIVKTEVKITTGHAETVVRVFFSELCASFMLAGGILCGPEFIHKNGKYTVIGNIHDNPELLNGGNGE
jgi:hypothetical protein